MKMIFRSNLAAAAFAGTTAMIPMSANAGVGVSVGIGVPGPVYYGPGYAGGYYYDPIYFGGAGPFPTRSYSATAAIIAADAMTASMTQIA